MAKKEFDLKSLSESMADAVESAANYVVLVNARRRMPASGVAFADDLILTANHVVQKDDAINIVLPDGSEQTAEVVGRDAGSDLCLLKLAQASASPAEIETAPKIGQLVFSLGRPSKEGIQASFGVVSAISSATRTRSGSILESHIRTDAIPYPGFSGGPLINAEGKLLGINTSGLGHGNSIAIPAQLAWNIAVTLRDHGGIKYGYLGIRSQPVEIPASAQKSLGRDQQGGLLVVGVEADSPAEAAGLMVSDILVGFNNQPVETPDDLLALLSGEVVDRAAPLELLRGGEQQTIEVTLTQRTQQNQQKHRRFRFGRRGHRQAAWMGRHHGGR